MAAFLVAVIDLVYPVVTRNMLNVYIPNQMLSSLLTSTAVLLILYLVKMGMNYFYLISLQLMVQIFQK